MCVHLHRHTVQSLKNILHHLLYLTILLLRNHFFCLVSADVCILHVRLCVCLCCITVYSIHTFSSVHSHTIPHTHTHAGVSLSLCAYMCLSVPIHILYEHMPLCHREKGGVSIFPSPFFGDNDGHFFFSVTDDRQN